MLGLKAKAGLLFFVSAGIFIALVAFGNIVAPKKIGSAGETNSVSQTAQVTDALQDTIGDSASTEAATLAPDAPITSPNDTGNNLTQTLAALIGKSIVDKNPEGPQNGNISVADPSKTADEAMLESINAVDLSGFYPIISANEFSIGSNESWAKDIRAVLKYHTETLKQKKPSTSFKDDAHTILLVYAATIEGLKQITIPAERITQEQQLISILEGERYALEAIEQYESDPIRGIVALHMLSELNQKLKQAQAQL